MRHPEFPIVSFLCLPLLFCSIPSHIRAGSVSTIALIVWLGVMSIIRGVNALVWADNTTIKAVVWCDITTKIVIGFTYAVPTAALCILRHLESVASTRHAQSTHSDKRRRQKIEAVMCFGIPILFMALHYIVQGHRFDLIEDLGCSPAVYVSIAAICILYVPPLAISLITMVYAALVLRHFLRHRISFVTHLQNSQSSISPARYFRLMALAIVEMAWDTGTNIYILWFNISVSGLRPWISWADVHSNFSRIGVFPVYVFPPWLFNQFIIQWWIIPISCFFFFFFFGFGVEAMSDYHAMIIWVRQTILRRNFKKSNSKDHPYLPTTNPSSHRRIGITLPPLVPDDVSEHDHKGCEEISIKMSPLPQSSNPSSQIAISNLSKPCATIESISTTPVVAITGPFAQRSPLVVELPFGRTPSPSTGRRPSTTSESEIWISQAYLPNAHRPSKYHEQVLLTPHHASLPLPQPPHPFGGVLMTVETTVVSE